MRDDTRRWIEADRTHCWHPFTRQDDWCDDAFEPVVITHGDGVWLWDSENRRYLDGNSSIWTNLHGHRRPEINRAIHDQLDRVSHSSFLGFTHPSAIELAGRLCGFFPPGTLERVFYSDDGSTAIECALKMEAQFRIQSGEPWRTGFLAFENAYHGDTLGAASLGGVSRFSQKIRQQGYPARHLTSVEDLSAIDASQVAAVIIEPVIQGVNQMRPWPEGMLRDLRDWCDAHDVHLILDEVMTGFGRTGTMFACQRENVVPDFLCLAKGLTAGYLPMAATLTTAAIYDAFRGPAENAFYYGHSYTANPLGCAAALASLDLFETENLLSKLPDKHIRLRDGLQSLRQRFPMVNQVRGVGLAFGMELRRPDGTPYPPKLRLGEAFCYAARRHGLLTRPILDTIVIMPPLSIIPEEIDFLVQALESTLNENPGIDMVPDPP